jgi:hypothetical protein
LWRNENFFFSGGARLALLLLGVKPGLLELGAVLLVTGMAPAGTFTASLFLRM